MTQRFLFVADPLASFQIAGDTTFALMSETQRQGIEVWFCEIGQLALEHDTAFAQVVKVVIGAGQTSSEVFTLGNLEYRPLGDFSAVFMRKDPPVNVAFIQATWILEAARNQTLLVNDPRGLRELNEHLSILHFPQLIPPTLVTRDVTRLKTFLREQNGAIIVKPVDGYGGLGVFLVKAGDPNASSIFETATMGGAMWTMAQAYLPAATRGDKRIIVCDGEPVGAILRVPPPNEVRDNLHVGGTAEFSELTARDREICKTVAPLLKAHGQIFVGLDVIGDYLTEINITSPTGIRHMDRLTGKNHAEPVISWVASHASKNR